MTIGALAGALGRAAPWGTAPVDTVARALVAGVASWTVLRLLSADSPTTAPARVGRGAAAIGAALVVAAVDGYLAMVVWLLVIGVAVALAGPVARRLAMVAAVAAVVASAAGVVALLRAADEMQEALRLAAAVEDDLLVEPEAAHADLQRAARRVDDASAVLDAWWARPARLVPVVSRHVQLGDTVLDAATGIVDASFPLVGTDVDDVVVSGRLDLPRIAELSGDVAVVADLAADAEAELEAVDRGWLFGPARSELDEALAEVGEQAARLDRLARVSAGTLPILGADGPVRWFVLVCTPAEARASCGFPGNWVELMVDDGDVELVDAGRTTALEPELEAAGATLTGPAEFVAHYGRFDPVPVLRNVTLTPDFPSAAEALASALAMTDRARPDVIAAVNTDGLEGLLRVTGPVDAGALGELNPANVRDKLEVDQYRLLPDRSERVAALDEATRAIAAAITQLDDVDPRRVRQLDERVERGGLLAWIPGDPENVFVEMGASGALPEGPLAGVTAQNAAGNKLDAFRAVRMTLVPATDETEGCATVELTLGTPPPGSPDYVVANTVGLPDGWIRSWVSIYTPTTVVSATLDGRPVELERRTEMGHPVVALFVDTAPSSTSRIELVLEPGATTAPTTLDQPSVEPFDVTVSDGRCPD